MDWLVAVKTFVEWNAYASTATAFDCWSRSSKLRFPEQRNHDRNPSATNRQIGAPETRMT